METKKNKRKDLAKISKSGRLSLVAEKLKGKVLFPERIAEVKKYLQNAKIEE